MHRRPSNDGAAPAIANFQRTTTAFSSKALKAFAEGGPDRLVQGTTPPSGAGGSRCALEPAEQEGRVRALSQRADANTANEFAQSRPAPPGWARSTLAELPQRHEQPGPHVRRHRSVQQHHGGGVAGSGNHDHGRLQHPDAGAILPPKESCILHPGFFANMFKTPQLRGVRHTAPYFHDNSAKDLEAVLEQYVFMFTSNAGFPLTDSNILLTEQDITDIIAFLRLL
jgi:cytochrome c peroxidase